MSLNYITVHAGSDIIVSTSFSVFIHSHPPLFSPKGAMGDGLTDDLIFEMNPPGTVMITDL